MSWPHHVPGSSGRCATPRQLLAGPGTIPQCHQPRQVGWIHPSLCRKTPRSSSPKPASHLDFPGFWGSCSAAGGWQQPPARRCYPPGARAEDEGRGREDTGRSHGKGLQSRLAGQSLFNHTERVYSQALKASGDHKEHPAQLLHTHRCRDRPSPAQTGCTGTDLSPRCPQSQSPHCPAPNRGSWPFAAAGSNSWGNTWPQLAHFRPSTACRDLLHVLTNSFSKASGDFPNALYFQLCSICFLYTALIGFARCTAITKHWGVTGMQDDREEAEAGERFTTISKCHKAEALHAAAAGAVLVALEPRVWVPTTYSQLPLMAAAAGTGRLRSQLTPLAGGVR